MYIDPLPSCITVYRPPHVCMTSLCTPYTHSAMIGTQSKVKYIKLTKIGNIRLYMSMGLYSKLPTATYGIDNLKRRCINQTSTICAIR